jgi:hypothetical protein
MPATIPAPTPAATAAELAGWIARLVHLRDDVAFGLGPRGVAAQLADLLADMQTARRDSGPA